MNHQEFTRGDHLVSPRLAAFAFRVAEREAEKPGGVPFLANPRKRALAIQGTGLLFSLIGAIAAWSDG